MATTVARHAKSVYVKTFPYKSTLYRNILIYREIKVLRYVCRNMYNAKHRKTARKKQSTTALLFFTYTRVVIYGNDCIMTNIKADMKDSGRCPTSYPRRLRPAKLTQLLNNQESAPTAFMRWQSSHCQRLKGNNLKELPECTRWV